MLVSRSRRRPRNAGIATSEGAGDVIGVDRRFGASPPVRASAPKDRVDKMTLV
jgi:hypothetical protein